VSALSVVARPSSRPDGRAWAEVVLLVVGLGAIVAARLAATRGGLDALLVGAGFAAGLFALALARGPRIDLGPRALASALVGAGLGLLFVGVVLAGAILAGSALVPGLARPASPFVPWAAVTVAVAVAEEAVLRGLLFDRLRRAGGTPLALIATTVLFAVMHVPLYGWHVVPLDLAVGLALGGLRVATRGIVAPAAAHAVADLATWWL
jgi:membrane protease YdiL (CAAX protease family)